MTEQNNLKPLTANDIAQMSPADIVAYTQQMAYQAETKIAKVKSESKARIQWETFPIVYKNIGFGLMYYNAQAEPDGKSRYVSLFLYEMVGREISYPLTRIECNNPLRTDKAPDKYKMEFISKILEAGNITGDTFTEYHDSSWKGLPFNRLEPLDGLPIVRFTYPVRIAFRLRETPNEWTDKQTGELRQGTRRRYGFALRFEEQINDYQQEIERLQWR